MRTPPLCTFFLERLLWFTGEESPRSALRKTVLLSGFSAAGSKTVLEVIILKCFTFFNLKNTCTETNASLRIVMFPLVKSFEKLTSVSSQMEISGGQKLEFTILIPSSLAVLCSKRWY